jgi:hypothetical protein
MKKLLFFLVVVLLFLITIKKNIIYYTPIDIPGTQMAATIPPFGIFIEKQYKKNKSLLNHEMVHWDQYNRMGFFGFYSTYLSEYLKYGRKYGPMEKEARKLSKLK